MGSDTNASPRGSLKKTPNISKSMMNDANRKSRSNRSSSDIPEDEIVENSRNSTEKVINKKSSGDLSY